MPRKLEEKTVAAANGTDKAEKLKALDAAILKIQKDFS